MESIVFNLFRYILLFLFIYLGKYISNNRYGYYWKYTIIPILIYTFMEGTRWMRGVDYIYNYNIALAKTVSNDILYDSIAQLFHVIGFPFYIFFMFVSALLIISIYSIVKDFKEAIIPIIILLYAFTMQQSENLMRQYCAISFMLLGFSYYFKQKTTYFIICLSCAFLTHKSVLIIIPILFLANVLYITSKNSNSFFYRNLPWIFLILYAAASILSQIFMDVITNLTSANLMIETKYLSEDYLIKATQENMQTGDSNASFLNLIRNILRNIVVIMLGFRILQTSLFKPNKKKAWFICYFFACFGIIYTASLPNLQMEVIARLGLYFQVFIYFIEGYLIYIYCMNKKFYLLDFKGNIIRKILIILVLMESIWIFKFQQASYLGLRFIWVNFQNWRID